MIELRRVGCEDLENRKLLTHCRLLLLLIAFDRALLFPPHEYVGAARVIDPRTCGGFHFCKMLGLEYSRPCSFVVFIVACLWSCKQVVRRLPKLLTCKHGCLQSTLFWYI